MMLLPPSQQRLFSNVFFGILEVCYLRSSMKILLSSLFVSRSFWTSYNDNLLHEKNGNKSIFFICFVREVHSIFSS